MSSRTYFGKSKTNLLTVFTSAMNCCSINSDVCPWRLVFIWVSTPLICMPKRTSYSPIFIKYTSSTVRLNFEVNVKSTFCLTKPGHFKMSLSKISSQSKTPGSTSVLARFERDYPSPALYPTLFLSALKKFCFTLTFTILRFPVTILFSLY